MDEGWTRWVLDRGGCLKHEAITDEDIRAKRFEQKHPVPEYLRKSPGFNELRYDTIIIPDQTPGSLLNGYRKGTMPPDYTGGLGNEGVDSLREFAEQGGTVVFLNRAADLAIAQFKLPLRNIVAGLPETDFFVPGSILQIELDTSHPLARGMPKRTIGWVEDSPIFDVIKTAEGRDPASVRIIGRYPETENPLLSGWLLGANRIKGKAALVEVTLGKGRIILFGFRPQYRAQSLATYPLFFNAIRGR
jgi:hypothetical protein